MLLAAEFTTVGGLAGALATCTPRPLPLSSTMNASSPTMLPPVVPVAPLRPLTYSQVVLPTVTL